MATISFELGRGGLTVLVMPRTLRFRVVLLLLVVFVLCAGAFVLAMDRLLVSGAQHLELGRLDHLVLGVRAAVQSEVEDVAGGAGVLARDPGAGPATAGLLADLGLDFVVTVDGGERVDTVVAAGATELPPGEVATLRATASTGDASGLVRLPAGPAAVASRRLPGGGLVLAGRRLRTRTRAIGRLFQTDLTIALPDERSALSVPPGDQGVVSLDDNVDIGWTVMPGLDGEPAVLAVVREPRPFVRQARDTLSYLRGGVALLAVLVGLSIVAMVEGSVLNRLARMRSSVIRFAEEDDSALAVPAEGSDEIADLAVAFNDTLGRIKATGQAYKHDSRHDHLTGLANRRALAENATRILASGGTDEHPCCTLVLLDLDGFKRINDDLGHQVGDEVLVWFAQHMRECLRADSTLCRLGGDEFAVLMPRTNLEEATVAVERLREVTSCDDDNPCFGMAGVRFSVGYAVAPDHGDTLEMLSQCADTDLYANKRGKGDACDAAPADGTQ